MASQSLYRKYRPRRFGELVGQEHVTSALRHAVISDRNDDPDRSRLGHAYLFSGPRGTGKTTTARILAKALNCQALTPDGEPCCECDNCRAVAAGTFYDLVELDAASNRTVDRARDLVSTVATGLAPHSRRKVYVLDEVHMLTTDASNTLLKTLEEPPAHVLFVLATTDPQKVLPTIRSRTQHFEFTLLSRELLTAHLADVLGREGIEAAPEVLERLARRAAGSVRDALTLLDQALALGHGSLEFEMVEAAFGGSPFEQRMAVLEAIAAEDPAGALAALHEALVAGSEPRSFADDLLRTARDVFVVSMGAGRVPYDGPPDELPRLQAAAEALGPPAMTRAIDTLGQTIVDIRGPAAPDPRLLLEVAVVRLARRDARTPVEALAERVERLERQAVEGRGGRPAQTETPRPSPRESRPRRSEPGAALGAHLLDDDSPPGPATSSHPDPPPPRAAATGGGAAADDAAPGPAGGAADPDVSLAFDDVVEAWPIAIGVLSPPVRGAVQDAQPIGVEGSTIVFGVPSRRFDAISGKFRAEADTIKAALASRLGHTPKFLLRPHDFEAPGALRQVSGGNGGAPLTAKRAAPDGSRPAASGPAADPVDGPVPDREVLDLVDLEELTDAEDTEPPDQAARLAARFGAEVVEEHPRA